MKKILKINNVALGVEIVGKGPHLLCLNGFGCTNYLFDGVREELSKFFSLVLLDNRGTGLSSSENELENFSIDDMANDSILVMKKLGIEKYHILAVSMGGFIAQKIMEATPSLLLSVTLVSSTSSGQDFVPLPLISKEKLIEFYNLPPSTSAKVAVESTIHPKTSLEIKKRVVKLRLENLVDINIILKQKAAVDLFMEDAINFEKIKTPTLIISGIEDRYVDPRNSIVLTKKLENSSLKMIANADHLAILETPNEIVAAMKDFNNLRLEEKIYETY